MKTAPSAFDMTTTLLSEKWQEKVKCTVKSTMKYLWVNNDFTTSFNCKFNAENKLFCPLSSCFPLHFQ